MLKSFLLLALTFVVGTAILPSAVAQSTITLNDLSAFQKPSKNWQIVGSVSADLEEPNQLSTTKGTGVLVNLMDKIKQPKDLYTQLEHGDVDLELDYMMAKESNSGIYLQGRYEVQLLDSWGDTNPWSGGNAGIYERWDESKPEGQKGYQGYAPRQNVSRAPGLWQHLKIAFQAPRFDDSGNKIENAKMLRVELNGVVIHEDVELLGPTRGPMSEQEVARGPLRFQGDHGDVAFCNIKITQYDKPRPELTNLTYTVYEGKYETEPSTYDSLPPESEGASVVLTSDLRPKTNQFLIRYQGMLNVKESGEYTFDMKVPGGGGLLRINEEKIIDLSDQERVGTITLPAGEIPFELLYSKHVEWIEPALGLNISGPGVREYLVSDELASRQEPIDPILVDPQKKPILRSFMDLPDGPRVTHAVSVGSPQQVHYTYDLDHGSLVQIWRGGFLDATPMWHDRGDGSSRPRGSVHHLGKPTMTLAQLPSADAAWTEDTTGTQFRTKGYTLDGEAPTFRYQAYGTTVEDAIHVLDSGHGFQRELTLDNPSEQLYARLATGDNIELQEKGLYTVDDKSYYLRIDDAGGAEPMIREVAGGKELVVPVRSKLTYSMLF